MPHGVPQFSGAVGGFCNGGMGNVGDLPSYQETVRGGGAAAAAAAWYSNPEPRYPTSKRSFTSVYFSVRKVFKKRENVASAVRPRAFTHDGNIWNVSKMHELMSQVLF